MFCPHCGTQNLDSAQHCAACGITMPPLYATEEEQEQWLKVFTAETEALNNTTAPKQEDPSGLSWEEYAKQKEQQKQQEAEAAAQQQLQMQRNAYLQSLPTWKRVELLRNWENAKKKEQENT